MALLHRLHILASEPPLQLNLLYPAALHKIVVGTFSLEGTNIMVLNGNKDFPFTEAISLLVKCDSQEKVDRYWAALTADGGAPGKCGWLKDKYGVSWQLVPTMLERLAARGEPAKTRAMMQALWQMNKIETAELQAAYDNGGA